MMKFRLMPVLTLIFMEIPMRRRKAMTVQEPLLQRCVWSGALRHIVPYAFVALTARSSLRILRVPM